MKRVTRLSRSIFGGILFSLSLFHLADGAARTEIVHVDTLGQFQEGSVEPASFVHSFVALQALRVTNVTLATSSSLRSSLVGISSMSLTINDNTFSYAGYNFVDGTISFTGDVEIIEGHVGTIGINCTCTTDAVYLATVSGQQWASGAGLWFLTSDERYSGIPSAYTSQICFPNRYVFKMSFTRRLS